MRNEQWKLLDEGHYSISNLGRVKSEEGKILNPYGKPYKSVGLYFSGIRKQFYVHVLVAKYFIGTCPLGKEVNHKDLNKANNRDNNLEYKTHRKNVLHAIRHGVTWGGFRYGDNHPLAKVTFKLADK